MNEREKMEGLLYPPTIVTPKANNHQQSHENNGKCFFDSELNITDNDNGSFK